MPAPFHIQVVLALFAVGFGKDYLVPHAFQLVLKFACRFRKSEVLVDSAALLFQSRNYQRFDIRQRGFRYLKRFQRCSSVLY